MKTSDSSLDELTVSQLLRAFKPSHIVVITGILIASIGGAFSFGISWEIHRFDVEITPLKKKIEELQGKNTSLSSQIEFYREKDKFISLTSTLQFQASMRGVVHDELFTCSGGNQRLSNSDVQEIYNEYESTIQRITNSKNGKDPIAFYGPVSRACSPRRINFDRDQSAAYKINNFIPNN